MIAKILQVNGESREVTVFADYPEIDQPEVEKSWNEAVLATCPDQGACDVGKAYLVSMLSMSKSLREAVGAGPGPSGLIVGIRVPDHVLKRIESGSIKTFNLEFDESGVRVTPQREPEQQSTTKVFRKEKHYMSDLISKCQTAVVKGDMSGLTRDDFAKALEQLATKFAVDNQELTHEQAYSMAMKSETGRLLYQGYDSCPATVQKDSPSLSDVHVPTTDDESEQESESEDTAPPANDAEAWAKVEAMARKVVKASGYKLSTAKAIEQVLKQNPQLYDAYETARRKRQVASGSH
jgi:hypothetical protein